MKHLFTLLSGMIVASSSFAINLPPLNPETSFTPVRQAESRFKGMRAPAKETAATLPSDLWGFNCEPYTWLTPSANGCTDFGALTEFSGSIATALAGKKITKLGMVSPVLMNGGTLDLTLYITYDPEDEAIAEIPITTSGCPVTPDGYIDEITYDYAELPEPITIEEGTPFYVGIKASSIPPYTYPVSVDYVPYNGVGMIMKSNASNGDWYDYTGNYGCACFYIGLDEGPENMVRMMDFAVPTQGNLGETFNTSALVINLGRNDVESATFNIRVGEQDEVELTATGDALQTWNGSALVGGSLRAGLQGYIDIKDIPLTTAGQLDVLGQFVKVNGEPNGWENSIYSGSILVMEPGSGFPRTVVVEEGTGTWCGWCVRGYVGMEYMAEKYGNEGNYIGIAVHSGDEMEVASYSPMVDEYFSGFPMAMVNRSEDIDPNSEDLEAAYIDMIALPTYATIDLNIDAIEGNELKVTSTSEFALSENCAVAYVIKEDKVGPYTQANYYSGGGNGPMDGFESKPSKVKLMYNEVARSITDAFGIEGSLPSSPVVGEKYTNTVTLPLGNVKDVINAWVVAMIINQSNGTIINATQLSLAPDAVKSINDNAVTNIYTSKGTISLNGSSAATVYTLDGAKVANIAANGSVNVAPGIYLVRTIDKAVKLIVK